MNGKSFFTDTLPNTSFRFKIPPGKYVAMLIRFAGTNQAGQTLANTDLGIITILKSGVQKYNVDFEILQQSHNAQEMGAVENASAIGAAFTMSCLVPFVDAFDDVCLDVQNANEWEVVLNAPNCTVTIILSGTVEFVGVQADEVAVSPYELQIINHHVSPGAAGTFIEPLFAENIETIWIEKDAQLTHLGLVKDGAPFIDYMTVLNLNALTNLYTRTETFAAAIPYLKLDVNPTKDEGGAYSNDLKLQYTVGAACTIKMIIVSKFKTPDRLVRSAASRNVALERKAQLKARSGLTNVAGNLRKEKVELA